MVITDPLLLDHLFTNQMTVLLIQTRELNDATIANKIGVTMAYTLTHTMCHNNNNCFKKMPICASLLRCEILRGENGWAISLRESFNEIIRVQQSNAQRCMTEAYNNISERRQTNQGTNERASKQANAASQNANGGSRSQKWKTEWEKEHFTGSKLFCIIYGTRWTEKRVEE